MHLFLKLTVTGLKRRKREMRYISAAAFIAVLFMSSVTLFQTIMDRYLMETNYQNYGDWVLSAVKDYTDSKRLFSEIRHPYLTSSGLCLTGADLLNEKNEPAGVYIGFIDEGLKKLGNISLYEGRFPESEQEIAMDLSSLSRLGLSYEPGQTVRVAVQKGDKIFEKEFLLTGTLKSFAANWKHSGSCPLPNCIVTEESLKQICKPSFATYFYQLDRMYENLDMEEFASAFFLPSHIRTYNSYVYENRVWGSREMFHAVKFLLTMIGALSIGYLMMSYVSWRRKWYYRLRCMGADKWKIRMIIFAEAAYGTFPYTLLGMALPYAIGAFVCALLSKTLNIPWFFQFQPEDFFMQLFVSFGIILFVVFCAWLKSGDKSLTKNSKELTKRQIARLRRDAKKERNTAAIFLKRLKKLHPFQQIAFFLFSFIVCLILSMCINKITQASIEFSQTKESFHDFSASADTELSTVTPMFGTEGTYGGPDTSSVMYEGISPETEKEIESLIGIAKTDWRTLDKTHILHWEAKRDSPVEQAVKESWENHICAHASTQFTYYKDDKKLLKRLKKDFDLKTLDEDAFLNGEEIILMLSDYEQLFFDKESVKITETTLHPGDLAEIVSAESQLYVPVEMEDYPNLSGRILVKIGAVIYEPPYKWREESGFLSHYRILASERLAKRVADADGKPFFHNDVNIDLNSSASFEATEKRLASIFKENGFLYYSSSEELSEARNAFLRNLSIYGVLLGTILFIFLLLQIHFHQMQNGRRQKEYRILKQLGMEWSFWGRMTIKESLLQSFGLLFSIPLSYAVMAGSFYLDLKKQQNTSGLNQWSDSLLDFTTNPAQLAADQLRSSVRPCYLICFMLLLIAALTSIAYLSAKKLQKEESVSGYYNKKEEFHESNTSGDKYIKNLRK